MFQNKISDFYHTNDLFFSRRVKGTANGNMYAKSLVLLEFNDTFFNIIYVVVKWNKEIKRLIGFS